MILWTNDGTTTVSGGVTATDTTVTLAAGTGQDFPNPGPGDFFAATFWDAATQQRTEIVYCTARSGDVVTMQRGQEGTEAQDWNPGDSFSNLLTAGTMAMFRQTAGAFDTSVLYEGNDIGGKNSIIVNTVTPPPYQGNIAVGMAILVTAAHTNDGNVLMNVLNNPGMGLFRGVGVQCQPGDITQGDAFFAVLMPGSGGGPWWQLVSSSGVNPGTPSVHVGKDTSGNAAQIIAACTPVPVAYANGMLFNVKVANNANGACTANFNNLGAFPVKKHNIADIQPGDYSATQGLIFVFNDSGWFDCFGCAAAGPAGPPGSPGVGTPGSPGSPGSPGGPGPTGPPGLSFYYGGLASVFGNPQTEYDPGAIYGGSWFTLQTNQSWGTIDFAIAYDAYGGLLNCAILQRVS